MCKKQIKQIKQINQTLLNTDEQKIMDEEATKGSTVWIVSRM